MQFHGKKQEFSENVTQFISFCTKFVDIKNMIRNVTVIIKIKNIFCTIRYSGIIIQLAKLFANFQFRRQRRGRGWTRGKDSLWDSPTPPVAHKQGG